MPVDVFFHLDRLRCLVETDGSGHSEPYVWTMLLWIDDTTIASSQVVASSAPGNVQASRVVVKAGIKAGEEAPMPSVQRSFSHRFEDGLRLRNIGIVAAMFEEDETPGHAVSAAYSAFVRELPKALAEFILTNFRAPTEEEQQQIADQIRPTVMAAGRDALSAFEKLQVLLGSLNLDDQIGFDAEFVEIDGTESLPETFTLRFVTREDRTVTNQYEIDGRIELRQPPPPDTCQTEIDKVKHARAAVDGLEATIRSHQQELQQAPPSQKPAIIAEIRRIRRVELPAAAVALEAAQRALALCRG